MRSLKKTAIVSWIVAVALAASACENVKLIEQSPTDTASVSSVESETTVSDDSSWKTATLTEDSGNETTVPAETEAADVSLSVETTTIETSSTATETASQSQTENTETTDEEEVSENTEMFSEESSETTTAETIDEDDETSYDYSFAATVISTDRKYIIVKPDVGTDEYELSRRIVVYCDNALDLEIGDTVEVCYIGEFGEDKDDMPTIVYSTVSLTENDKDVSVPDVISSTRTGTVEVVRIYEDGLIVSFTEENVDFDESTMVNLIIDNSLGFEKGQILGITYSSEVEYPDNDYPIITVDDYEVQYTPQYVVGVVSVINKKGMVISFVEGTLPVNIGTDVIVVAETDDTVDIGDKVRISYDEESATESEPYIIFGATSADAETV